MVYLTLTPKGKSVGVEQLAKMQNLSPTYLSKILTKLVKAGLLESTPGVNGGYSIAGKPQNISFLDVIHAIEGKPPLFNCSLEHGESTDAGWVRGNVMGEAEQKVSDELSSREMCELPKRLQQGR